MVLHRNVDDRKTDLTEMVRYSYGSSAADVPLSLLSVIGPGHSINNHQLPNYRSNRSLSTEI